MFCRCNQLASPGNPCTIDSIMMRVDLYDSEDYETEEEDSFEALCRFESQIALVPLAIV